MNLWTLFAIARARTPQKEALEFVNVESGNAPIRMSYEELYTQAERWATAFAQMGLRKGDRVAFFLGNRPEFVIAYLAVLRAGAIMVPINLRYRRMEIYHILNDCTPRFLVTEKAQEPILAELTSTDLGGVERILAVDAVDEWLSPVETQRPPLVHGEDLALIMYTSGTTGRSKGAMISHNNVLATVTGLMAAWAWQADDVILLPLPLFHVHGLVVGLHCALASGATVRLRPKFDAEETIDVLAHGGATLFFGVPTLYVRLLDLLERMDPKPDFNRMRLFCSGSAPLAAETYIAFEDLTGHRILERYGMTETGMNLSNPYIGPRVPGSVGTPLPGVFARIVDGQNHELAPGSEGELLVRGSNVFDGYWNDKEKTAASFSVDEAGIRWFHTGDLAVQDPESGYVTLLGRRHELIISGGFNIYPREIEELLLSYPGIRDAAVIGAPHPEWGEVPLACLVCEGEIDEISLVNWCKSQLASFKVPRHFRYVNELPRNAMGKVLKHLLK
ncbi:MAG: acyl-CoA synthetase [Caldilineaceae bacterium]|nr:acyl-CoA synthetase [Caldilineaceae bacterium]